MVALAVDACDLLDAAPGAETHGAGCSAFFAARRGVDQPANHDPQRGCTAYGCDFTETCLETGLLYARARMYSPGLGRFVSRDPFEYIEGASMYAAYFVPGMVDPKGTYTIDKDCCDVIAKEIKSINLVIEYINQQIAEPQSSLVAYREGLASRGMVQIGAGGTGAVGAGKGKAKCIQEAIDYVELNSAVTIARRVGYLGGGSISMILVTAFTFSGEEGSAAWMSYYLGSELAVHLIYRKQLMLIADDCTKLPPTTTTTTPPQEGGGSGGSCPTKKDDKPTATQEVRF